MKDVILWSCITQMLQLKHNSTWKCIIQQVNKGKNVQDVLDMVGSLWCEYWSCWQLHVLPWIYSEEGEAVLGCQDEWYVVLDNI